MRATRRSRVRVSAAVLMVVLTAARRGIVGEVPGEQRLCGSVRRALHAAIEADARLRERHLHAAADAAEARMNAVLNKIA